MRYRWLLFDADRTLFDYDLAEAKAFDAALALQGVERGSRLLAVYRDINEALWRAVERGEMDLARLRLARFERLLDSAGLDADPQRLGDDYVAELGRRDELLDGARRLLDALHGRAALALVTNGLAEVQRPRLASSGLERYFDAVVISSEVGAAKPDRRIFDETFRRLGDPPREQALMIGDSLSSDMRGGAAAGLDTCWFNPAGLPRDAGAPVDHEISHLDQLPALLDTPAAGAGE